MMKSTQAHAQTGKASRNKMKVDRKRGGLDHEAYHPVRARQVPREAGRAAPGN